MRTYRLQFSENSKILMKRFQKALAAKAERILCQGFDKFPLNLKQASENLIWAVEHEFTDSNVALDNWDESHVIVKNPQELLKLEIVKHSCIVIQPLSHKHKNAWLTALKTLSRETLSKKIFFEFLPWDEQRCDLMTVQEIVSFLYEVKFHIKDWKPARRPGVNLWDWRVGNNFELEASDYVKTEFNLSAVTPKLSVIVPTYNNKYFVSNVIAHLCRQSLKYENYEIILVDDGSSDMTFEYLLLNGTLKNIQLTYLYWPRSIQRKRGDKLYRAGLSRNLGVRHARADKIVFLDSDMIVPTNFIETTLHALQTYDVVQFPRFHIRQDQSSAIVRYENVSDKDTYIEEEEYWKKFFDTKNWQNLEKHWKYTCTYGLALSKEDFYLAGRFPHFYISYGFEDTELGYRLALMKRRFHLQNLKILHLTSYSLSEYQFSKKNRHKLLARTAKLFFLNTLEIENFHHLEGFMHGENTLIPRFKKVFDFLGKNKSFHEKI